MHTKTLHKHLIEALDGIKAENITTLDVRKMTSIADLMVICSGRSQRHVRSIADHIATELRLKKIRALSIQGELSGEWVIVDFGAIVVHIMLPETRQFYAIEKLWSSKGSPSALPSSLPADNNAA